jgi:choline dehydrogenase
MVPELQPFRDALTKAWTSKGGELNNNVYEGRQAGLVKNINTIYDGLRSTSVCFLDDKPSITVLPELHVTKILLEDGTATGITATNASGSTLTLKAKKEIILSAGAFQSPQLLLLSGIGPAAHLSTHNIPCKIDSPHVGQNLLDHPILPHVFKLKRGMGMDHHLLFPNSSKEAAVAAYTTSRSGPLRSGLLELVAFPRIDERLEKYPQYRAAKAANGGKDPFGPDGQPHFEVDFVPMFSKPFQWNFPSPEGDGKEDSDYLTVIVDLLRPVSKAGSVTLGSADAMASPVINQNFCNDDLDVIALREGVRHIDDILMHGEGMKELVGEDYPWPMPRASDGAMDRMVLERLQTGFHPCGSCRMGDKGVEQGVVDGRLRVHGVKGLRVVDASVMPVIPDCRIQNGVYMVGERGAEFVKEDWKELYGEK